MAARPMLLDGGLATTLQRTAGLPSRTPVEPWLTTHPDAIRSAHAAFVEAGSEILLTATFLAATCPDWPRRVEVAVNLARAARPSAVWLALGPVETEASAAQLVEHAVRTAPVDGVVLETVTDVDSGLDRMAACRSIWDGPLVLSVVPGPRGSARNGRPLDEVADEALQRGATGFGVNCVSGPLAVRAVEQLGVAVPVWVKPSADHNGAEAFARLWQRATWIGGCCGTTPDALRKWADALTA